MFERDYIMRLLGEFFQSLAKVLRKKEDENENFQDQFTGLYLDYLSMDNRFFYEHDTADILIFLKEKFQNDMIQRAEMLAELLYNDALLKDDDGLLRKSLELFQFINDNDTAYSMDRQQKITEIEDLLDI